MTNEALHAPSQHRLNASNRVIVHAALAASLGVMTAHCGGDAGVERRDDASDGGSQAPGGAAGRASGGAWGATFGLAGALSYAGDTSASGASALPSATAQWECDPASLAGCASWDDGREVVSVFALSGPCIQNPSLPRAPSDCAPGERLSCAIALSEERPILVNCRCTPAPECECPEVAVDECAAATPLECTGAVSFCGCEQTCSP